MRVGDERGLVGPVAEKGEPARVPHDDVELVAVDDQQSVRPSAATWMARSITSTPPNVMPR